MLQKATAIFFPFGANCRVPVDKSWNRNGSHCLKIPVWQPAWIIPAYPRFKFSSIPPVHFQNNNENLEDAIPQWLWLAGGSMQQSLQTQGTAQPFAEAQHKHFTVCAEQFELNFSQTFPSLCPSDWLLPHWWHWWHSGLGPAPWSSACLWRGEMSPLQQEPLV